MTTALIDIRVPTEADASGLAELHRAAWHYAYRGIIPGITLDRMIACRGVDWWRRAARSGRGTLVLEFEGTVAGYAQFGPSRTTNTAGRGEIYELYLKPEFHGARLGCRLFRAARLELGRRRFNGLIVWSLTENRAACRFYRAMGGKLLVRSVRRIGGNAMPMSGYVWP